LTRKAKIPKARSWQLISARILPKYISDVTEDKRLRWFGCHETVYQGASLNGSQRQEEGREDPKEDSRMGMYMEYDEV